MLKNVLGFHRMRVDDVMVPRADIVAVPIETTLGDLLGLFRTAGHSRLPVYGETLDDPRGMVHIRDFLDYIAARAEAASAGAERPAGRRISARSTCRSRSPRRKSFVLSCSCRRPCRRSTFWSGCRRRAPIWRWLSTNMAAPTAWSRSRIWSRSSSATSRTSMTSHAARMIVRADGGAYRRRCPRRASTRSSEALGVDVAGEDMAEDVDTIGGLIVTLAGRVRSRGELVAGPRASSSRCSTPIRAASSGCASTAPRRRRRQPGDLPPTAQAAAGLARVRRRCRRLNWISAAA